VRCNATACTLNLGPKVFQIANVHRTVYRNALWRASNFSLNSLAASADLFYCVTEVL